MRAFLSLFLLPRLLLAAPLCSEAEIGPFLTCDQKGQMVSVPDKATGASIADYSSCGFANGTQKLPLSSHVLDLKPSGHDDTKAIQAAIDTLSHEPLEPGQLRGIVYLAPGKYTVSDTIKLNASGISIDGAGPKATVIAYVGHNPILFQVGGIPIPKTAGTVVPVEQPAPSGSKTLKIGSPGQLKAGDTVLLSIPHNMAWLKAIWGGHYPPVRDGKQQAAWGKDSFTTLQIKTIASIGDGAVTFMAPITDAVPAKQYQQAPASLRELDVSTLVRWVGVRHLSAQGRYVPGIVDPKKLLTMAAFDNVQDAWLDDIQAVDFGNSFAQLGKYSRRVTVQDMVVRRTKEQDGGAKPFDFSIGGTEALIQGVRSEGNKTFYVATQSQAPGPNAVYNSRFVGGGTIEPHQRWATGLLLDNVSVPQGGIAYIDRATAGSGHGWSIGNGVVFNCQAGILPGPAHAGMDAPPGFTINQPPMSANWGMGLVGPRSKRQAKDARVLPANAMLAMPSLIYRQRMQALGAAGLKSLMGPYRLIDAKSGQCLTAHPKAGSPLVDVPCGSGGDEWEITSYGNLRLLWSDWCLDAGGWAEGQAVSVAPCELKVSQAFSVDIRTGAPTTLKQKARKSRTVPLCVTSAGHVGGCAPGGDVRVVPASIAAKN